MLSLIVPWCPSLGLRIGEIRAEELAASSVVLQILVFSPNLPAIMYSPESSDRYFMLPVQV